MGVCPAGDTPHWTSTGEDIAQARQGALALRLRRRQSDTPGACRLSRGVQVPEGIQRYGAAAVISNQAADRAAAGNAARAEGLINRASVDPDQPTDVAGCRDTAAAHRLRDRARVM